jgi:hypothetical protein
VRDDMAAVAPKRTRSRTLAAGTDAVHAAGAAIVPPWPGEEPDNYARRVALAEFVDFYGRIIEATEGMVMGAELGLDGDMPAALAHLIENADGQGTHLHGFGRQRAKDRVLDGWVGVLAEFPRVDDPNALSVRDVQERALRPYFVPVEASQVLSWRHSKRGSESVLTQLVIAEGKEQPAGEFGTAVEPRYRVYRHDLATNEVSVEVLRIVKDVTGQKTVQVVEKRAAIVGPPRIPLAYKGKFTDPPPLDRLAWGNIGHHRVNNDHRTLMATCAAPTVVVEKADPNDTSEVKIGPNGVWRLTGEQTAKWFQAQPDALEPHERTMERQQQQMAALGMAFLSRDKTARNETVGGRQMDAAADRASLGTLADAIGAMLTDALRLAASYVGNPPTPVVTVTPDYDIGRLDAQTITALGTIAAAGKLTTLTLLRILANGDVLPDGLDLEAEAREAQTEADVRLMNTADAMPVGVAA